MKEKDAELLLCPFTLINLRHFPDNSPDEVDVCRCITLDCMAWEETGEDEGYCKLIEKGGMRR